MESRSNQMTDCRIKRIKKISNAFYNSSVIMAILSMIVYYCCDMEKNNIIIMKNPQALTKKSLNTDNTHLTGDNYHIVSLSHANKFPNIH